MQKLVIGMRNNQGFTLVEILVVLVIIGITFGFALVTFGDFGQNKRVVFAAEHMINNIRLAQQQAILDGATLGVQINNTGYQILQFDNSAHWHTISNAGIFKANYFPENTLITLRTTVKARKGSPSIIINGAGDMTPFTLSFWSNKKIKIGAINGSKNGALHFILAEPK